ncbi:MAG: DUF86 domain-containing protein [Coriobacteriia bacterium]|nr:DUF86 domain-containing protein [Coriobacteriia bacterium]
MRSHDPLVALHDVLKAGLLIERFLKDLSFAEYQTDSLIRSAVERQFEVVGEALKRALKADPGLVASLPDAPAIIGFRNVLAHGYDEVVDGLVFKTARESLPGLLERVRGLLDAEPLP